MQGQDFTLFYEVYGLALGSTYWTHIEFVQEPGTVGKLVGRSASEVVW